jgi:hypothetical protein
MNTPESTPQPPSSPDIKSLIPALEKLTAEQFETVRKQVSTLVIRQGTAATERFQFFMTKTEADAIRAIAKREKIHAAKLFRYYLRCVHPELATLTARTKKALTDQQKLISALIADDRIDMTQLAKALANLETKTGELMKIMEERR